MSDLCLSHTLDVRWPFAVKMMYHGHISWPVLWATATVNQCFMFSSEAGSSRAIESHSKGADNVWQSAPKLDQTLKAGFKIGLAVHSIGSQHNYSLITWRLACEVTKVFLFFNLACQSATRSTASVADLNMSPSTFHVWVVLSSSWECCSFLQMCLQETLRQS